MSENAPFGYRLENGMLYPVPDEAEIVRKIFEWYLAGDGFCKIAGKLNDLQVGGKAWVAEAVRFILSNEKYIGDMEFYTKSIMDEVSYAEKSNEIRKRLTELRSRRLRMLADNDDEGTLSGLRAFKQKLEGLPKAVIEFDLSLFKNLIKEVIVTRDEELIFVA